ncbi:hypothetical protein Tco_0975001 [Tanacetum coccineum]|uniref:Uncharacterized protein n=1 Tax=Tanacetum coccineum TaxID=301880 RepID=A0ABQ5ED48_9ASTR
MFLLSWQLAMRESCKYIEDKLGVKVENLGKETLVNSAKTSMALVMLFCFSEVSRNIDEVSSQDNKMMFQDLSNSLPYLDMEKIEDIDKEISELKLSRT